jgi:hypothetical protein
MSSRQLWKTARLAALSTATVASRLPTVPRLLQLNLPGAPAAWRAAGFAVKESDTTFQIGTISVTVNSPSCPSWMLGDGPLTRGGGELILPHWSSLRANGHADIDIDSIETSITDAAEAHFLSSEAEASHHPNGALGLYSVCVTTPDLDATVAALQGAGLELRRVRKPGDPASKLSKGLQMAFFKLGVPKQEGGQGGVRDRDVVLEVIAPPPGAWGDGDLPRAMPGGFAVGSRAAIAGMVVSVSRDGGLEAVRAALGSQGATLLSEERDAVQGKGRRIVALRHEACGLPLPMAFLTA